MLPLSLLLSPPLLSLLLQLLLQPAAASDYFGTPVGKFQVRQINSYASMKFPLLLKIIIVKFQNRFHGIEGDVFAVDSRTLYVRGFSYDGTGPVRANSQKIYYSLFAATENSLL